MMNDDDNFDEYGRDGDDDTYDGDGVSDGDDDDDDDDNLAITRNTTVLDLGEEKPRGRVEDRKHLENEHHSSVYPFLATTTLVMIKMVMMMR